MAITVGYSAADFDGATSGVPLAVPFYAIGTFQIKVAVLLIGAEDFVNLDPADYQVNELGPTQFEVVLDDTYPSGVTVRVYRSTPRTQPYSFSEGGPLPAESIEAAYDWQCMIAQETATGVGLAGGAVSGPPGTVTFYSYQIFEDATDRGNAAPLFVTQLGIQADTGVMYRGTSLAAGAWSAINVGSGAVAAGGTGRTSFTPYALVAGGTGATDPLQQVSGLGSSGQILTSAGEGALPTWQTPAVGSGDVTGPNGVTAWRVALFADNSGKLLAEGQGFDESNRVGLDLGIIQDTTARPFEISQIWDNPALVGSGIEFNLTDNNSDADSTFLRLRYNSTDVFVIRKDGTITTGGGTYTAGTGLQLIGNQFSITSSVVTTTGAQALSNKIYNGLNIASTGGSLDIGSGCTLTMTSGSDFTVDTGPAGGGLLTLQVSAAPLTVNFGGYNLTFTTAAPTNVTLPSSGILATRAGVEALTNKSVNGVTLVSGGSASLFLTQAGTYAAGNTYTNGTGIQLVGNQFSIDATVVTLTGAQALTNKTYNGVNLSTSGGASAFLNATGSYSPAVTSVQVAGGTTGLIFSGGPITGSGTITMSGTLAVANGGSGANTLTGILKGNGTSPFTAATPGTDYVAPPVEGALTSGTTVSWDMVTTQVATLILDHNATIAAIDFPQANVRYQIRIKQGAAGPYTLAWDPTYIWPGGVAPTLTPTIGRTDIYEFTGVGGQAIGRVYGQDYNY